MAYQATFKRYEIKYLLTRQQKQAVLQAMQPYMKLDQYGRTTIRNIYYDTDTYRLIRRSLEKPVYKEKLRIRSYQAAAPEDLVFVELKKKYKSVVYKRRLTLPEIQVRDSFQTDSPFPVRSQIAQEIEYFRSYYERLHPTVFLSYEREAFYALDGGDFRVFHRGDPVADRSVDRAAVSGFRGGVAVYGAGDSGVAVCAYAGVAGSDGRAGQYASEGGDDAAFPDVVHYDRLRGDFGVSCDAVADDGALHDE